MNKIFKQTAFATLFRSDLTSSEVECAGKDLFAARPAKTNSWSGPARLSMRYAPPGLACQCLIAALTALVFADAALAKDYRSFTLTPAESLSVQNRIESPANRAKRDEIRESNAAVSFSEAARAAEDVGVRSGMEVLECDNVGIGPDGAPAYAGPDCGYGTQQDIEHDDTNVHDWYPKSSARPGDTLTLLGRDLQHIRVALAGYPLELVSLNDETMIVRLPEIEVTGALTVRKLCEDSEAPLDPEYEVAVVPPTAFDLLEPDPSGLSWVNAYLFSATSFYVYEDDPPSSGNCEPPPPGYSLFMCRFEELFKGLGIVEFTFIDETVDLDRANGASVRLDTQAVVMSSHRTVIVAFRGTEASKGLPIPPDLMTDFDATLIDTDDSWHPLWADADYPMRVHRGFYEAHDLVYEQVRDAVREYLEPGKKLWVTGHSLGGALASLTAYRLHRVDGISVTGVHTYGTPLVGNLYWASAHDHLGYRTWRWVNHADLVARVPQHDYLHPEIPGTSSEAFYRHVGTANVINSDHSVSLGGEPVGFVAEPLYHHLTYCQHLYELLSDRLSTTYKGDEILELMPEPTGGS